MARSAILVPMNLGSGREIYVSVSPALIDYFNITAATITATEAVLRKRKAYTRKVYNRDTLGPTHVKTAAVEEAEWYDVQGRQRGGRGSGKLIKVPTELPYDSANLSKGYRLVSLRLPQIATNYTIANWINTKFTQKKPLYFLTPSGQRYPVNVPAQTDPNPGNDEPDTNP